MEVKAAWAKIDRPWLWTGTDAWLAAKAERIERRESLKSGGNETVVANEPVM